jgi:aarF domain-containing kinase
MCGTQSYLKMLMWDNLIHADLHPGNVLIRIEAVGALSRVMRWLALGDASAHVPHIVLLDAGLAARFNEKIFSNVRPFFDAITACDGVALGRIILSLAPAQPHVPCKTAFVDEISRKCAAMQAEAGQGGGASADNIRSYMQSVRMHRVVLDPSVMVALMSMLVLEGWQKRLDPTVNIMSGIEKAVHGGAIGHVLRLVEPLQRLLAARLLHEDSHTSAPLG